MDGGGGAGDGAGAYRAVVGAVEVDSDGDFLGAAVEHGADGAEGFGEDGGGAAVEEAVGLGVAFDGEGADDAGGGGFLDLDAHAGSEGAGGEQLGQVDAQAGPLLDDVVREPGAGGLVGHGVRLRSCACGVSGRWSVQGCIRWCGGWWG